ncbi:uncharacterized protein LOC131858401 [Cryptomeria japonica]|uniref:uncharacterized protein LOC131858401 n=1 Tax=Cryptomeria japonica TaxID=3369 RepID=UPI0027DA86EB|nr:uncharacterized protein LOC131858401 [Cryptomeria japonica]
MTWVTFLKEKSKALEKFKVFKALVENKKDLKIKSLRFDNGGEITSNEFVSFCEENGIKRQISQPRTPQQYGFVERKNRTVQEMARSMMNEAKINDAFWREVAHTVVYIQNRGLLRAKHNKTPYELRKESVNVKVHEITNTCNEDENGRNNAQKEEAIGAAQPSSNTQDGTTSINVQNSSKNAQSEVTSTSPYSSLQFGTADIHYKNELENDHGKTTFKTPKFVQRNHPVDQTLPENRARATRRNVNYFEDEDVSLLSMFEPKYFEEAPKDKHWIAAMKEELDQIQKSFKVFQMDVKSVFFNGNLSEDVYAEQLDKFILSDKHNYACKLKKALYGLKQATRAWYDKLDKYLQQKGFRKGMAENKLYVKEESKQLLIVVVYVADLIFGGDCVGMCKEFATKIKH